MMKIVFFWVFYIVGSTDIISSIGDGATIGINIKLLGNDTSWKLLDFEKRSYYTTKEDVVKKLTFDGG